MSWGHDELADDLAVAKAGPRRMVWTDMQIGPSGSPRPDVYTIEKSYTSPRPVAYEVKVTVSDFRSDVTSGKYLRYYDYAGAVIFAVPDGLIGAKDVPEGCGLIVRKAKTWRTVRKPTVRPVALKMDAVMKLLIDGVDRRDSGRRLPTPRKACRYALERKLRQRHGNLVADIFRDHETVLAQVDYWKREAEKERESLNEHRDQKQALIADAKEQGQRLLDRDRASLKASVEYLCATLCPGSTPSMHALRRAVNARCVEINADAEVRELRAQLASIRRALNAADNTVAARADRAAVAGVGGA